MKDIFVTDSVKYIGTYDRSIDLFEGQYPVPNGISYNSYVIIDEKTAVMDTADKRCSDEWLANLESVLSGRKPDYMVVNHVEPDHAGSFGLFIEKYPDTAVVGNAKTFTMLENFFEKLPEFKRVVVKEGDTLSLGNHTLKFITAPMVHWPEVMVTYEESEGILFSADGFGRFGAPDSDEDWDCEARRYYFNIVGKYGMQVQSLLRKASALDIKIICPLHGPVLKEELSHYTGKYALWSSYAPEDKGVFIAYASIHGNTAKAAEKLAELIRARGEKAVVTDLARCDMSEAVEDAFRYDRIVFCASSYDGGVFLPMENFLVKLSSKTFRSRTAGIVENGSWGPTAARTIKEYLGNMKDITVAEPTVTIRSALKETDIPALEALADALCS